MPIPRSPAYRLDLWTAPRPAGGTRVAFLVEPGGGRAAFNVQATESIEPGQSRLTFEVLPDFHAVASLAPQSGVVALTRFTPTGPDAYTESTREWRITARQRTVRKGLGAYRIACVPLEEDLQDADLLREVGSGGLATWRYGATDRLPADVLGDIVTRLAAVGITWVEVGTVDSTTPVTFELIGVATPYAIAQGLVEALAATGETLEFNVALAADLASYELHLVTRIAGALDPLLATTDANAHDLTYGEDALEQANVVIPFTQDGVDLRELQVEIAAIDAGTGWVTLQAIGGGSAVIVAVDDQFNAALLFRELTGRTFAIVDTSASPQRVQLAVADLASGLAVGERVSFRASDDLSAERRGFGTATRWSPLEVVSTLTGPPRIRTQDLFVAGASLVAANQWRDWTAERSTLVAALPSGTFDHTTGILSLVSAPSSAPAVGDWIWFKDGAAYVPGDVTAYSAGTWQVTLTPRYADTQFTATLAGITSRCYRPTSTPMWIVASLVANGELQVDAFTGGTPAAGDVLEIVQRCQGVRLVEVTDPSATTATRRKVARIDVACTGATNRVENGDLSEGASSTLPEGWTIEDIVGTVTRTRPSDPLYTRYGGWSWSLDFGFGASCSVYSPLIPIHRVHGMEQVSVAVALLFSRFSGNVGITVTLYAVAPDGTRTALSELAAIDVYPPDATVTTDAAFKAALDTWYDATLTNQSIAELEHESLQIGITRAAGASNPVCTLYIDAAMLLQREGLPSAADGGVQYVFASDALPLLAAANAALLDRAHPLVRLEGRFLDVFRVDGARYAPFELVPGRDVQVTIPPLALTRTVRLLTRSGSEDDPGSTQVVLDRVRPNVGRLLAARVPAPSAPARPPITAPVPPASKAWLSVRFTESSTQVVILWGGSPSVELSIDGGAFAAPSASPITVARNAAGGAKKNYHFRTPTLADGTTATPVTVTIFPQESSPPATPRIIDGQVTAANYPGDGGGDITIAWTHENMPVGHTFDINVMPTQGDPITDSTGETDTGITSSPHTVNIALGPNARADITITARDSGGVELHQLVFPSGVLPA